MVFGFTAIFLPKLSRGRSYLKTESRLFQFFLFYSNPGQYYPGTSQSFKYFYTQTKNYVLSKTSAFFFFGPYMRSKTHLDNVWSIHIPTSQHKKDQPTCNLKRYTEGAEYLSSWFYSFKMNSEHSGVWTLWLHCAPSLIVLYSSYWMYRSVFTVHSI